MKKLTALAKHIEALPGISRDQMEAFVDMGKLRLTGEDKGKGLEVGKFRYDAVISIESCPAELANLLLADILIWLGKHDPERGRMNLEEPDLDISLEDEQTVFVQITVEFDESLCIVPDPDGPLEFEGQMWRVDDVPIDTAENLDSMEKR